MTRYRQAARAMMEAIQRGIAKKGAYSDTNINMTAANTYRLMNLKMISS
ncbi:hypothetical protein [Bacillus swezeyi]